MNALELIDDLEKYYALKKQYPDTVEKVVTMLRQQQTEIEALKDNLHLAKQSLEIIEGWIKK